MTYIDIKKLNKVEDCDTLIVQLIQEGYKKYLSGKGGIKELNAAAKVMKRSQVLQERQKHRERTRQKINKKIVDEKKDHDIIQDLDGENFRSI